MLSGHTSWSLLCHGEVIFTLVSLNFSVSQFPCGRNKSRGPRMVVRTDGLMQRKPLKQALLAVSPFLTSEETELAIPLAFFSIAHLFIVLGYFL